MHIRQNSTQQLTVEVSGVNGNDLFKYLPDEMTNKIRLRVLFALQTSLQLIAEQKRDAQDLDELVEFQIKRESKSWGEF